MSWSSPPSQRARLPRAAHVASTHPSAHRARSAIAVAATRRRGFASPSLYPALMTNGPFADATGSRISTTASGAPPASKDQTLMNVRSRRASVAGRASRAPRAPFAPSSPASADRACPTAAVRSSDAAGCCPRRALPQDGQTDGTSAPRSRARSAVRRRARRFGAEGPLSARTAASDVRAATRRDELSTAGRGRMAALL